MSFPAEVGDDGLGFSMGYGNYVIQLHKHADHFCVITLAAKRGKQKFVSVASDVAMKQYNKVQVLSYLTNS